MRFSKNVAQKLLKNKKILLFLVVLGTSFAFFTEQMTPVFSYNRDYTVNVNIYRPTSSLDSVKVTYYKVGEQRYAKVEFRVRSSSSYSYTLDGGTKITEAITYSDDWSPVVINLPLNDNNEHNLKLEATGGPYFGVAEATAKLRFKEDKDPKNPSDNKDTKNKNEARNEILSKLSSTGYSLWVIGGLSLIVLILSVLILKRVFKKKSDR